MARTEITWEQYDRRRLHYASDCTDEEWALIEPFIQIRTRSTDRANGGCARHGAWPRYGTSTGCSHLCRVGW